MLDFEAGIQQASWQSLLEVVEYDGHVCGIITGSKNLLEDFDMTMTTCERMLDGGIMKIKSFEGVDMHYVHTETSWRLPGTGTSLHCPKGCVLAADPSIDDLGVGWWKNDLGCQSYQHIVPEDIDKVKSNHMRLLQGHGSTVSYRAKIQNATKEKTVRTDPYQGFSKTFLAVQHTA